jgi:predicted acylesterase/phospholipase RssA
MGSDTYADPHRLCDLVMKGGVTSGVVYPLAVCELAKIYSFKNIGGTSAGAIAAAAAAAAECGRRSHSAEASSFDGLAKLPDWIGKPGRLVDMFRPDRKTRALFELLMAGLNAKTRIGKGASIARELLLRFPITVAFLVTVVWAIRRWLLADLTAVTFAYAYITTILLALLLFVVVVLVFLYRQITGTVPANFYGMSLAYDSSKGDVRTDAPLTNWLTHYLNELAGKPLSKGPLTFGDLYAAPRAPGDPEPNGPEYKAINLEMMTTALNHGRPYRLPFRDPDRLFYFSADEFARLFPPAVVQSMIDDAPESAGLPPQATGCGRLYAFPAPNDLPVVVATRMSLSFPVLLGAVPLYAVDYTLNENQEKTKAPRAERCWFSDGGISSNLPIHFFDAPLPLWPTFAINLKQFHPDYQNENDAVWLPDNVRAGMLILWTRFEEAGRFGSLSDFLWTIVNTMQNWQDTTQSRVPGYRDRLVHVSQRDDEGGLNLNMPEPVVGRLADRGRRAGEVLIKRFGEPANAAPAGWTEHRWVRFRSCMELTSDWIQHVAEAYPRAIAPDPNLEEVLLRPSGAAPSSYRLAPGDQQRAKKAMDALVELWAAWNQDNTGFQSDPPRPTPELRVKARV